MTAPIVMDPTVLSSAAATYARAHDDAQRTITTLADALDTNWGCAGTDNAGGAWADSYDPAAARAVAAGTDLVNAFGKLHDLLAVTAIDHGNVEKANAIPPQPPDPGPGQLPYPTAPQFRGSYGGDTDAPFGWGAISRWLQGHTWPNGDPDKLRSLGDAWAGAARGLRAANDATGPAWAGLGELSSGEMPQVLGQLDAVFTVAEDVAMQYEQLGSACTDWARQIDDAHAQIFRILAEALAAGLVVGITVGVATAGMGTGAVAGGAGATAGAAIAGVLVGFESAAAVAAGVTTAAGVAVAGTATRIQPLLDANPTVFEARTGGVGGGHHYVTPPKKLPAFPDARPADKVGPRYRNRWKDSKGRIYEWDYQHGTVEMYSKNGQHLGEYNPTTGQQTKPPNPTRQPGR